MAFIKYITYENAPDNLKKLYEQYGGANKTPANIVRVAGIRPAVLENHITFYQSVMHGPSSLSRDQREMIAVVVSSLNNCHY